MAKKYYLPSTDAEKSLWLNNFAAKLSVYGVTLGVTPAQITAVAGDAVAFDFMLNYQEQIKTFGEDVTTFKNTLRRGPQVALGALPVLAAPVAPALPLGGIFDRITARVAAIKTNPLYTTAMGEDMGIIGDEQDKDIDNAKPVLKLFKDPSGWRIKYSLEDFFDGVNIYKKLPTAAAFTFLGRDTSSPYIDTAAVVSGTHYYAYFVLGDQEVGLRSDEAVVSV